MPQPSPGATVPRQFRLGPETLDHLDRIAAHHGLRSRAEAIRFAARLVAEALPGAPEKSPGAQGPARWPAEPTPASSPPPASSRSAATAEPAGSSPSDPDRPFRPQTPPRPAFRAGPSREKDVDTYTLTRTGDTPLRFRGEQIAAVSSRIINGQERNRWFDLALYRTAGGAYVAAVAFRSQWQGEHDDERAAVCETAAAVRDELTVRDPIPPGIGYPAGAAYQEKQARLYSTLRRDYEALVSELFAGVDEFAEVID